MRQRDEHIRRYAELLEAARDVQSTQNAAIESKREDGRGHRPQGIPRQIAEETGLSVDTVRRALKPAPVANLVSVKEAETDEEAAIVPQNAEQIIKPRGRPVTFYVPPMCHGVAGILAKVTENQGKW